MKTKGLQEKIDSLKRFTLKRPEMLLANKENVLESPSGFKITYNSMNNFWVAGFSRTPDGKRAFHGRTATEAMDSFLENFKFTD